MVRFSHIGASIASVSACLLVAAVTVAAEPARAKKLFDEGLAYFNLGKYDKAVAAWEEGYREKPDPQFLYNIGQAHRLAGDEGKAVFFYRNYLRESPNAKNRPEVERKIATLEQQMEAERQAAVLPPPVAAPPIIVVAPSTTEVGVMTQAKPVAVERADLPWELGVAAGAGAWLGGGDGAGFAATFDGGRVVRHVGAATRLRVGARVGLATLGESSGSTRFVSVLVGPAVAHDLGRRLEAGAELGVGLAIVGGLRPGSKVLRDDIVGVDGSLATFEARATTSLRFALTPAASLFVAPSLAYAAGRSAYFPDAMVRFDVTAGALVRFGKASL